MSSPFPPNPANEPTMPNVPGALPGTGTMSAAPKRSRRGLWIALSVILVLLLAAGGGGYYLYGQYTAPGTAAANFCTDLKQASYSQAYGLLSSALRSQFTAQEFSLGSQEIDSVEGKVTSCASTKYTYSLFASTATVDAIIQRSQTHEGTIHLKQENGSWKVAGLDTSLLGVNLGALKVAGAFCAALQAKDYATAFGLFDPSSQAGVTQTIFVAALQAHDVIDGPVTGCMLTGIDSGNSDTLTNLTVSLTRTKLGAASGQMTLSASGGAWKITNIASGLQGTDIGSLLTGAEICVALMTGNLATVYETLTSRGLRATVTEAQFLAYFALRSGEKFTDCTPDLATFKIDQGVASYDVKLTISLSATASAIVPVTVFFIQEDGNWVLAAYKVHA